MPFHIGGDFNNKEILSESNLHHISSLWLGRFKLQPRVSWGSCNRQCEKSSHLKLLVHPPPPGHPRMILRTFLRSSEEAELTLNWPSSKATKRGNKGGPRHQKQKDSEFLFVSPLNPLAPPPPPPRPRSWYRVHPLHPGEFQHQTFIHVLRRHTILTENPSCPPNKNNTHTHNKKKVSSFSPPPPSPTPPPHHTHQTHKLRTTSWTPPNHTHKNTHKHTQTHTNTHTNTHKQTNKKTNKQTNKQTHTHTQRKKREQTADPNKKQHQQPQKRRTTSLGGKKKVSPPPPPPGLSVLRLLSVRGAAGAGPPPPPGPRCAPGRVEGGRRVSG